jgi:hypothetical protein
MRQGESHASCEKRKGKPERLSKILQAKEISTVERSLGRAKVRLNISIRSQVAGVDGVSHRQAAVELETVIVAAGVPEMDHACSNSKE